MTLLPEGLTLPEITQFTAAWFTSGTLAVQRCKACGTRQHPPEEVCHNCGGEDFDHDVMSPRGTVHSYTVIHYAASPALTESLPYAVVLVALEDDPTIRVVGNLDAPPATVRIGQPVEAYWEKHNAGDNIILLPQWRAVESGTKS